VRLPISAQKKPPIASTTMFIRMSDGGAPSQTKAAVTARPTMATGRGTIPIRRSMIRHQAAARGVGSATDASARSSDSHAALPFRMSLPAVPAPRQPRARRTQGAGPAGLR
jgi:hypothetical protein